MLYSSCWVPLNVAAEVLQICKQFPPALFEKSGAQVPQACPLDLKPCKEPSPDLAPIFLSASHSPSTGQQRSGHVHCMNQRHTEYLDSLQDSNLLFSCWYYRTFTELLSITTTSTSPFRTTCVKAIPLTYNFPPNVSHRGVPGSLKLDSHIPADST